jgi:hypothetical protein
MERGGVLSIGKLDCGVSRPRNVRGMNPVRLYRRVLCLLSSWKNRAAGCATILLAPEFGCRLMRRVGAALNPPVVRAPSLRPALLILTPVSTSAAISPMALQRQSSRKITSAICKNPSAFPCLANRNMQEDRRA